jgi:hypothetical protein
VQCGQRAAGRDFEDGTKFVGAALHRCPVEAPIGGLDQTRVGVFAVRAAGQYGAKPVERGESLRLRRLGRSDRWQ